MLCRQGFRLGSQASVGWVAGLGIDTARRHVANQ
jgi:hypothetical protein